MRTAAQACLHGSNLETAAQTSHGGVQSFSSTTLQLAANRRTMPHNSYTRAGASRPLPDSTMQQLRRRIDASPPNLKLTDWRSVKQCEQCGQAREARPVRDDSRLFGHAARTSTHAAKTLLTREPQAFARQARPAHKSSRGRRPFQTLPSAWIRILVNVEASAFGHSKYIFSSRRFFFIHADSFFRRCGPAQNILQSFLRVI